MKGVDAEGFDGAGAGAGAGAGRAGAAGAGTGAADGEVELEALLPTASGGEVGDESTPPPAIPGVACKVGCSTSAYRHTGHVPLVFSHVSIQSSWNAW